MIEAGPRRPGTRVRRIDDAAIGGPDDARHEGWRHRARSRHDRRDERRDRGFSIPEILITISLVAVAVIPLMDATITSIRASTVAREAAEVETVLANAADRVNRAPALCDYTVYVEAAVRSKGWPAGNAVATYQYYVPGPSALAADAGTWAPGACPNNTRTSRLIQLVTITVTSLSGDVARTISVVKSDV